MTYKTKYDDAADRVLSSGAIQMDVAIIPAVAASDVSTPAAPFVNAALGNVFTHTMSVDGNMLAPTNPVSGQQITIIITQDPATPRLLTWAATWQWPNAVAPTLTATVSAVDIVSAVYNGATSKWLATFAPGFG